MGTSRIPVKSSGLLGGSEQKCLRVLKIWVPARNSTAVARETPRKEGARKSIGTKAPEFGENFDVGKKYDQGKWKEKFTKCTNFRSWSTR